MKCAYYAMKREIARESEVTSVEYVRYRGKYLRYVIGRLRSFLVHAYIARCGKKSDRLKSRFLFSDAV